MTRAALRAALLLFALVAVAPAALADRPVIIIPGIMGSELVNKDTGEKIWLSTKRSKVDDIRLPVSANITANKDAIIAGDIIRDLKLGPLEVTDIYGGLIKFLTEKGGYHEADWDQAAADGIERSVFVFAYDWRRDNVESARSLVKKVEALKRRLKRPDLQFDIIAHSMGGLISRYAAMYGDSDLPPAGRGPSWAGSRHFHNVILLGVPNEGSALSLKNLIEGVPVAGLKVNLPFIKNISKFDVFTVPSVYQLLPAPGTLKVYDEGLQPIDIDIFDVSIWKKYGWSVIDDKDFAKEFDGLNKRTADAYLSAALSRARRFWSALKVPVDERAGIRFTNVGASCKETVNAFVLRKNKNNGWDSHFSAESIEGPAGNKIKADELKKLIYAPGDGTVTMSSWKATTLSELLSIESILRPVETLEVCESHDELPGSHAVQLRILAILSGDSVNRVAAS